MAFLFLTSVDYWVGYPVLAEDQRLSVSASPANPKFNWPSDDDVSLVNQSSGTQLQLFIKIPARYSEPDSVIIDEDRKISISEEGEFELLVPVNGPRTIHTIRAVTPLGRIEIQNLLIQAEPWADIRAREVATLYKIGRLSASLGMAFVTFEQSNLDTKFSQTGLTAKISYAIPITPPRWELGFNGFATVLPLKSNTGQKAYYLGLNMRIGYVFPQVKDPFRLALHTGLYYTTVMSSGGNVGFKNFAGPQIFPTLSYRISSRFTVGSYLKYASIANGLNLNLSNRELAGGLSLTQALAHERALTYSFDAAALTATALDRTGTARTLKSSSQSFSVGFAW